VFVLKTALLIFGVMMTIGGIILVLRSLLPLFSPPANGDANGDAGTGGVGHNEATENSNTA
ncbi:MAG: hypothetical protein K0U36_01120, partial [Alphaproteobacteria bacterium]|nr:hypothetical protein [Alphaproteobacteria bacterium]